MFFIVLFSFCMAIMAICIISSRKNKPAKNITEIMQGSNVEYTQDGDNYDYENDPITEKQKRYLLHLGEKIENMPKTKSIASQRIDLYLAQGKH